MPTGVLTKARAPNLFSVLQNDNELKCFACEQLHNKNFNSVAYTHTHTSTLAYKTVYPFHGMNSNFVQFNSIT